jgi:hypothetical protein
MRQLRSLRRTGRATRVALRRSTCQLRVLPDFLIIGAQRCGTTSLFNYLRTHPDVRPAIIKEVQFFSRYWTRGTGWYRAHFPLGSPAADRWWPDRLTFEATPSYLFHPLAAERAAQVIPQAKLLVLLRDPVERAWSHYRHMVHWGLEPLSFEDALQQEPQRLAGEVERIRADPGYQGLSYQRYSYLARGAYAEQLQVWLRYFPAEQFLLVRSEALFHDPDRWYPKIVAFLGLRPSAAPAFAVYNRYPPLPTGMAPQTRQRLTEHFTPVNQQLEELTRRSGIAEVPPCSSTATW